MPTLNVSNFSCLRDATFNLANVNVIIGPQGSGKSITTKLFYFCTDILASCLLHAERGATLDDLKSVLSKQFSVWFPSSAWGSGRFRINYNAGLFSCRILRKMNRSKLGDEVTVTFSPWFNEFYNEILVLYKNARETSSEKDIEIRVSAALDRQWKTHELINHRISSILGDEYISNQTFIPAGRAFFTSIGRLVAGFEQAGSLDPVTIKFARLFASLRDRNARRHLALHSHRSHESGQARAEFMRKLFGGKVMYEDEADFIETPDGRKVPFTSMSSGQQELLPMWALIDYFNDLDDLRRDRNYKSDSNDLVYIEEPEAHLFPSAQSTLLEFLIGSISHDKNNRRLIITTHSPYIMSKLNLFLKAGNLSRRKKKNTEINEIVPRSCWLNHSQICAYAIEDGVLRDIIDQEDGLIDGTYLDGISEEVGRDFSRLLMIEDDIVNAS